ncbi:hypothetical protein F9K79_20675 [Ochrobactrum sp. Kaboul]|nr:hypothetical protein F9K79_20675 [Ochrobactrum sp. Kaboul]
MSEKEPFRKITFEQNRENYAGICAVVTPALRTVIEELAVQHGNQIGPWFDELESKLITDAKGTIAEGFSISTDAQIIGLGVEVLQATLDVCRNSLVKKEQN